MGSAGGDLVVPAASVLVVRAVMLAATIRSPSTNTVHRLRATRSGTGLIVVGVWTSLSIVSGIGSDPVGSAALVLVIVLEQRPSQLQITQSGILSVEWTQVLKKIRELQLCIARIRTCTVLVPLTLAVHGLSAATVSALLVVVGEWTRVAIMGRAGGVLVVSASLILVISRNMRTGRPSFPSSYTVHRLSTSTVRALLVVVCVWTGITVVGSAGGDLIVPAASVLVVL